MPTLAGLKGRPEILDVLSADNVGELATGVAGGANVYELMLYLEDLPALGEAIVAWLTAETKIISNRTVLTDGKSWFDFLILSSAPAGGRARSPAAARPRTPMREVAAPGRRRDAAERRDRHGRRDGASRPGVPAGNGTFAADLRSSTVLRVRSDVIDRFMTQIGEIRIAAAELAEVHRHRAARWRDSRSSAAPASWRTASRPICGACRLRHWNCAWCRSTRSSTAFPASSARWPTNRARMSA